MDLSRPEPGPADARAWLRLGAVAAGLLAVASDAAALWGDQLEVFLAETVTSDSNVFRRSSAEERDTHTTTTAGFNFDIPVSRQRFQAGASWNQVRYNRLSDLNYLGHDGKAIWLWQFGDQLSGHLGYTETAALASFDNFGDRLANPLRTRRAYGDAAYMLTPSWELQAGLANQTQRNGNAIRQVNDVDRQNADLTINYVSPASNKIGLSLRQEDGDYPNRQLIGATLYENDYVQRSIGAVTDWTITGKSHLNARVDRVRRSFDQLSQRDYNGTTFRAVYDWRATGKLALRAIARKEISNTEDIQTSFVLVKGIALRPTFDVSEKIRLAAIADYSIRDYLGDPELALGTTTIRTNHVRRIGATVSYRPMRSLTLQLTGQHETRSSNVPLNDYTDNILSINARFAF